MIRYVAAAWLFIFAVLLAPSFADAQIFGRRGCSTGHCAPAYHAPYVAPVVQRDIIQQIFFAAPAGYIAPVGETVYGLQRALDLNAPDANAFLNNSNQHIAAASSSTAAARQVSSDTLAVESLNAETRSIAAKGESAARVIQALAGESQPGEQPRAVLLTLRNGVYESAREIRPDVPAEPQPVPRAPIGIALTCLKCHNKEAAHAPKGIVIDGGPISLEAFTLYSRMINEGTMPPKSALTEAERAAEILKLSRLVPNQ